MLPEDLYEDWSSDRRAELREIYLALLVELAGLHEEREEYAPGIEALELALAGDPAREEAHAGLMRLYAFSGRRREALAQYERLRKVLREKFDKEPGDATRRLYEEIRSDKFSDPLRLPLPVPHRRSV